MGETYVCKACGVEKGRDGFFKDVRDRRGLRTYECKACYSKNDPRKKDREPPAAKPLPKEVIKMFNEWLRGQL